MSPRPIVSDGENPFSDKDKWIRESANPLAWLFRTACKDLDLTEDDFSNLLDSFIRDPIHGIGQCSQERSTFRGNTTKDIKNNSPSWNKFLFLMKVIGYKDLRICAETFTVKGERYRDSVYVPLEGINVIGDDRQLDARNLPAQELSEKVNRKLSKEIILTNDSKYVNLALDEMSFLIRSTMMSANITLQKWNELMNNYVSHLDRAKRCTERNNFASQILFTQEGSWKTYIKFLRFIKTHSLRLEITGTISVRSKENKKSFIDVEKSFNVGFPLK